MGSVALREITGENRSDVVALRVASSQEGFVGTVSGALRDAAENPEAKPWFRAVYAGDEPVGFVMLSWDVSPEPPWLIGPWFLWKLLVDQRHQGRGYGRDAVRLLAEIVRANGATEFLTSCVQDADGPEQFYCRLGFVPTGAFDAKGELVLSLSLEQG